MKIRITFVCHGNICRSPAAELIFKRIVSENGKEGCFDIASGAATDEEIVNGKGAPVYPPMAGVLAAHGYDCSRNRANLVTPDYYTKTDLFIVMDHENVRDLKRIFNGDPENKVRLLMSFCKSEDPAGEVEDPWYTHRYEAVFSQIERGCIGLYENLTASGG